MMATAVQGVALNTLFEELDATDHVTDIATRAQSVQPGGLFLACSGASHHGLDYLDAALAGGATAVAWEPGDRCEAPHLPDGVSGFAIRDLSRRVGDVADRFFAHPSAALSVVGVTGTNGKSTTACLVREALTRLSRRAGYMGTLGYGVGDDLQPSALTTPGCVTVHRRLREMADQGAEYVIAEVSSHALDQGRVDAVRFQVAALTNLSRDHLDYHGSLERYAQTKAKLFLDTGIRAAVINVGDAFGRRLVSRLDAGTELFSVALVDADAGVPAARLTGAFRPEPGAGLNLSLGGDFGTASLNSGLWGRFNAENLVVATGILLALGVSLNDAVAALARCSAPVGRMQLLTAANRPRVLIDFAHTPDALTQALAAAREQCVGRLWCVFGCGGERDAGKRAPMGAAAAALADRCIVTDDNPRGESPVAIVEQILAGMPAGASAEVIHDRAAAIGFAVRSAGPDDVVLIAGRGHESVQRIGERIIQLSDAVVAHAALGLSS